MNFESIGEKHVLSLLDFELKNKAYFEKSIAPRDKAFYSLAGVGNHISELVYLQKQNKAFCYVVINDTQDKNIVARANLKNIAGKTGEIGYRVAEGVSGKGIASRCVRRLVEQAKNIGLSTLTAEVMDNNPASEKVLVKNGFKPTLCFSKKYRHKGKLLNSTYFTLEHLNWC